MLDLTFLYAHKGRPLRSHGFDEILHERDLEDQLIETGASSSPPLFPIVVWRCTRACNLNCVHCYSDSFPPPTGPELTTDEARAMIDDLAASRVSALVLSGGEPLLRKDILQLAFQASGEGMDLILATNGTLLTDEAARRLKGVGVSYVSVGLGGVGVAHDYYRGQRGSFDKTAAGIKAAQKAGLKVVVRINLTQHSIRQIPDIFSFVNNAGVETIFFYHLFMAGRSVAQVAPTKEEMRSGMDAILEGTRRANEGNRYVQVFIAGNICDGAYVHTKLVEENNSRHRVVKNHLLQEAEWFGTQGGEPLCIDWNGDVHPNPFWLSQTLGNVRHEKFIDIVQRSTTKRPTVFPAWDAHLLEPCSRCRHLSLCMSGFQPALLRDEKRRAIYPPCYLTSVEKAC